MKLSRGLLCALVLSLSLSLSGLSPSLATAAPPLKELIYDGKPVNGYAGAHPDFPAEFVDHLTCEGGVPAADDRHNCLILNSDGTGEWQNDAAPMMKSDPPTPIKWYVVADKAGTVTRVSDNERDIYFVIIEFTQPYYRRVPGDLYAFQAIFFKDHSRVALHSKYRNLK